MVTSVFVSLSLPSFSGVEGKVIHLVKRPPPSVAAPGASEGQGSTPGSAEGGLEGGGGEGEDRNVTVQASQDVVFVGNIPMSSHTDITQVTQVRREEGSRGKRIAGEEEREGEERERGEREEREGQERGGGGEGRRGKD